MFSHNIDFNRHVAKVHEKNKPFDCKLCEKKFSQNSDVNRHVASVHQGNKHFKKFRLMNVFLQFMKEKF